MKSLVYWFIVNKLFNPPPAVYPSSLTSPQLPTITANHLRPPSTAADVSLSFHHRFPSFALPLFSSHTLHHQLHFSLSFFSSISSLPSPRRTTTTLISSPRYVVTKVSWFRTHDWGSIWLRFVILKFLIIISHLGLTIEAPIWLRFVKSNLYFVCMVVWVVPLFFPLAYYVFDKMWVVFPFSDRTSVQTRLS